MEINLANSALILFQCEAKLYTSERGVTFNPSEPKWVDSDDMKTYGVEYDSAFYKSASALVNYGFRFPVISLPGTIKMYYPLNDYPEVNDAFDEGLISGYTIFRPPIPFREGETPGFVLTYDKCDAERLVAIAPELFALSTLEVLAEWDAKGCGLAGIDDDPDMKEHWQRVINTARLLP